MISKNFNEYRIYMRALEPDDYKKTVQWHNDPEIWSMVMGNRFYVSSEYEKQWIEKKIFSANDEFTFAICYKENDEFIGIVTLDNIDYIKRSAKFGKMIGEKEYWGKGIATEAVMLMLNYAFNELGLKRVQAAQLVTNKASIKVNLKCGFKNEGVLRSACMKDGKYVDVNVMGILAEEYKLKESEVNQNG